MQLPIGATPEIWKKLSMKILLAGCNTVYLDYVPVLWHEGGQVVDQF